MGLDTVELVMEMEETFGIVFDDLDAEQIGTVGQAYRSILGKLELRLSGPCPSAALFYRLRRSLMAQLGVDRRSIRPASWVGGFLPDAGRRSAWLGLGDELGMILPRPEFGPGLTLAYWLLGLSPVAVWVAAWGAFGHFSADLAGPVMFWSIVFGAVGLIEAYFFLEPFAAQIPRGCETIRGTIETILGRHRINPEGNARTWHSEEVWVTLRALISEQMGVALDQVTEDKSFVYDFGMD